jgi:hypothetical protein
MLPMPPRKPSPLFILLKKFKPFALPAPPRPLKNLPYVLPAPKPVVPPKAAGAK